MSIAIQDKIIAGIVTAHGGLGVLWTLYIGSTLGFPPVFTASNLALALVGICAGVGLFLGRLWAVLLGALFLLVQLFHFMSPESSFTFTLGLNTIVSAGWGNVVIGINIYALALLVWLAVRALSAQQGAQAGPASGGPAP